MSKKIFNYKGVKVNAFGIPIFYNEKARIKKKDRKRNFYYTAFHSPFKNNSPKNLIIMYDVPDNLKKERDWFRRHLIKFDYKMIQRSVWVGPSPLPKEFIDYIKEIKIGDNLKVFKLAKAYDPKKNMI